MNKNKFKSIAGVTLVEILIGIAVSALMVTAMFTTYNVVNNSYSQVTDRAKISRSGRDVVAMLMRDIRLAGYKFYFGTNTLGIPKSDNLTYHTGEDDMKKAMIH
jgi:Tfp pilus assembly protein PilW